MKYTVLTFIFILNLFSYQAGDRYKNEVIELKEDLSIGVLDGPEEYIFNRIFDIDADSKGNIYVADSGDKLIKVFDKNGKYLNSFGREGEGPGEFKGISRIFISKNDKIYVYDRNLRRITVFNNDLKFEKSFPLREKKIGNFFIDNDEQFILLERPFTPREGEEKVEINLYSNNMEHIRTIYSGMEEKVYTIGNGRSISSFGRPYWYITNCSIIPYEKVVFGKTDEYVLYINFLENNNTKKIEGKYNPVKVTKKDREDYFKIYINEYTSKSKGREIKRRASFPKYKPPFKRIIIDDTGYMILVTYREDEEKGTECDLMDFEGNFIKKIYFKNIPWRIRFKNGNIYSFKLTENEWYKAVRYRID